MSSLVYLLMFLSLHACNARHLGVVDKGTGIKVQFFVKEVQKEETEESIIPLKFKASISDELRIQDALKAENDEIRTFESWGGADTMKQKDFKALGKEDRDIKGNEIMLAYSTVDLQETVKEEGWKRKARSILGSLPHDTEETMDSKENDIVEDIVVMDYAQPHRKPPIHNREP
ncbi:unnamed protein product [Ilex paraguariensis]|uniref:Uncharacterized protein n=1 Tax=Ilex paraguariensis TaxID=185542 RepID=A0ABC8ULM5_9AQUA